MVVVKIKAQCTKKKKKKFMLTNLIRNLCGCMVGGIQWNMSWETTAMKDHLSGQTPHFGGQKDLPVHFSITEPVTTDHHLSWQTIHFWHKDLHFNCTCHQRPPVLTDHIFVANGVISQDRFYCTCMYHYATWLPYMYNYVTEHAMYLI